MVRSPSNSRIRRILVVGRDVSQLSSRANLLTQAGYSTDQVVIVEQAIRRANVVRYHLAIVSATFPYDEQLAILTHLKRTKPVLPVLLLGPEHDTPEAFLQAVATSLGRKASPDVDPQLKNQHSDEFAGS